MKSKLIKAAGDANHPEKPHHGLSPLSTTTVVEAAHENTPNPPHPHQPSRRSSKASKAAPVHSQPASTNNHALANKSMNPTTEKAKTIGRNNTLPTVKAALEEVRDMLFILSDEYSNAADSLPDSLQDSDRHAHLQEAGDAAQTIAEALDDVVLQIEEVDSSDDDDESPSQPRPKLAEATVKVSKLPRSSSKAVLFRRCQAVLDEIRGQVSEQWPDFAEMLDEAGGCDALI